MAEFENFGFYTIDADYLEYLNNKNSEVYYNASYRNAIKPFVGIIIDMTECKHRQRRNIRSGKIVVTNIF